MSDTTKGRVSRRHVVAAVAATAVAACDQVAQPGAKGAGGPAIVRSKRSLKLVTTWPPNYPGLGSMPLRVAKRVEEATDGDVVIKVYGAGELVPALESFDAVSSGAADMYHGAEYYWQGKSKGYNFFTAVPFGMNAAELNAWIYHMGGQQLWDELSAKFGIKPLLCGNTGVQMGGWFNREINTLDDLKGLKMRMPGLGGEVLSRLGASTVTLPGGEIFQALQSGTIDATEWVGPWNDLAFGFYRVAKYYYWPGFHEPGSGLALGVNMNVWRSLTKSQQAILATACMAEDDFSLAEYNAENARALRTLIEQHGVQFKRFSDEVFRALGKVSADVVRQAGETDALTKRIYESFKASMKDTAKWTTISEEGYAAARHLAEEG